MRQNDDAREDSRANPDMLAEKVGEEKGSAAYFTAANKAFKLFSEKEKAVFTGLIIKGQTKAAIAKSLGILPQTIAVYVDRIKGKIEKFL
jgi:DNA-binding NarL/FixJ family response regulator